MLKLVKVKAEDEKEALKKGIKKLANSNSIVITKNDVNIQLIEEKNGFLGFGGGDNLYLITFNEEDLEDEIEHVVKDIAIDGEYKLKINDKGIFLKVTPHEGGEKVSYQEIKQELDKKKIEELDLAVIKEVLQRAND